MRYIEAKYKYSASIADIRNMEQDEEKAASDWLRETQKGYIRIATLILLSKEPHHGYEIMKEIKERTRGFWKPTAGGLYPMLRDLQESGYIEGEWDARTRRRKRTYQITEAGRAVLKRALGKENQLADMLKNLFEEYMKGVLEVNAQPSSTFSVPRPLAQLLKETNEKDEDKIKRLERESKRLQGMIRHLHRNLRTTKKSLDALRRHED